MIDAIAFPRRQPAGMVRLCDVACDAEETAARRLVATAYAPLSRPRLSEDEVMRDLYAPAPSRRTRTRIALDGNGVAATISLAWASPGTAAESSPLEALHLFSGSDRWPIVLGDTLDRVGELSRFAIRPDLQRTLGLCEKADLLAALLAGLLRAAGEEGLTTVIASMQPTVTRLMATAGVPVAEIASARISLARSPLPAVFQRYPRYWRPDDPRLEPRLYFLMARGLPRWFATDIRIDTFDEVMAR